MYTFEWGSEDFIGRYLLLRIFVPRKHTDKTRWDCLVRVSGDNFTSYFITWDHLPPWFQELFDKTNELIELRDSIRNEISEY